MTPEIIAILGVGVALAGLIISLSIRSEKRFEQLERRFEQLEQRFERSEQRSAERFEQSEQRSAERSERFAHRFSGIEQRMARLEGILDGLREALFGRATR